MHEGRPLPAYGAVSYPISIVDEPPLRVFYAAAFDDPIASAWLDRGVRAAERPFAGAAGIDQPIFARGAMFAARFVSDRNADIVFARAGGEPRAIEESEALDRHPRIVADGEGFAVAWLTGSFPQPEHLAFARVDRDGRGEPRVIVRDARALPPIALARTPEGYLLFYSNHLDVLGLVVVRLDERGAFLERRTIVPGRIADVVAGFEGSRGAVAFQDHDSGTARVLTFDARGELFGPSIEIARDQSAELSPIAIAFDDALWIATIATFPERIFDAVDTPMGIAHAVERRDPEARIVRVDGERVLHTSAPAASIALIGTAAGVRGVLVESAASSQGSLRSFELRCGS